MNGILCVFFLMSWFLPAPLQAEEFLNTDESFLLAAGPARSGSGRKSRKAVMKACVYGCAGCDRKTGLCYLCTSDRYLEDDICRSCPENAECNGRGFVCKSGYFLDDGFCKSCSSIPVDRGTCTKCNNAQECTEVSCDEGATKSGSSDGSIPSCIACSSIPVANGNCSGCKSSYHRSFYTPVCSKALCNNGYYAEGGACKSCSSIVIENGMCTACNGGTECTSMICNSGSTESGSGMYGQLPSCVECASIPVINGTCSECTSAYHHSSYTPVCSKVTCNSGYYADGGSCLSCSSVMVANGKCTACSNDGTCTAVKCDSGYAYREKKDGVWAAGCYPKGNCSTVNPDMPEATCMNVGGNTWQCRTEAEEAGSACIPCYATGYKMGPGNVGPYYEQLGVIKPTCSTKGNDNAWELKIFNTIGNNICYACVCDGPVLQDGTCCKKGYVTRGGYSSCEPAKQ